MSIIHVIGLSAEYFPILTDPSMLMQQRRTTSFIDAGCSLLIESFSGT